MEIKGCVTIDERYCLYRSYYKVISLWDRVENETHIDARRNLAKALKAVGLLPILAIGFMVEPQLLRSIIASCHTCEVKRPHTLHVILLYCPHVRLKYSPHVRGCVENESHIDGGETLQRLIRSWATPYITN